MVCTLYLKMAICQRLKGKKRIKMYNETVGIVNTTVKRNKMKNTYSLNELEIPINIVKQYGPFNEFKQDVSFVTVELNNGKKISGVLLLYPNYIIAVEGNNDLPFLPCDVIKLSQTEDDLSKRSSANFVYFYNPLEFNNRE